MKKNKKNTPLGIGLEALIPSYQTDEKENYIDQNNRIGVLDGNRLIVFPQNLDKTYWTNPNGRSSNLEWVNYNSLHYMPQSDVKGIGRAYNYPNPIYDSVTTILQHEKFIKFCKEAKTFSENFYWNKIVKKYLSLIN